MSKEGLPETGAGPREFPTTRWSRLLELKDSSLPAYSFTLNELIEQYWKPCYHFIRMFRSAPPEDAKDLTQQFFSLLLEKETFKKLSPERGSFRGFLKTALRYFLLNAERHRRAREPKDAKLFHYGEVEAEWLAVSTNSPSSSSEEAFDREWVRHVLKTSIAKLETSLKSEGKQTYFDLFREYCISPAGALMQNEGAVSAARPSYGELAKQYGVSIDDVGNYLRVVRRVLRDILAETVKDYMAPGEDVERELLWILSS